MNYHKRLRSETKKGKPPQNACNLFLMVNEVYSNRIRAPRETSLWLGGISSVRWPSLNPILRRMRLHPFKSLFSSYLVHAQRVIHSASSERSAEVNHAKFRAEQVVYLFATCQFPNWENQMEG